MGSNARKIAVAVLAVGGFLVATDVSQAQEIETPYFLCYIDPSYHFCDEACEFLDPVPDYCAAAREPVLIVPGIVASHNAKRILKDQSGGTWNFTPSVNWFNPLIHRLMNEGYEEGKDLFVVHYDWRQGNIQSAIEYLMPAITRAKEESGAEKVDIIAHSMGGLVARAYLQSENLYRDDVDQFIMLGTPNEGAADAYVAWEKGDFPDRWGAGSRLWITRIERALRKVRNQQDLVRPLSIRAFFPSIKELMPITTFVNRQGTELTFNDLKDPNTFLQNLASTVTRLAERGIDVVTIAGNQKQTLGSVPINHERSLEDLALERWRDGHANPDPPTADSTAGDQTVLTSSVHSLTVEEITMDGVTHEELPGKAQEQVVAKLIANPTGDFVPVHLAQAAIGVDVLSPVMPVIHGPGGKILSATQNDFANAVFDWDPEDPDGIKQLTITDPPAGEYTVDLTGTNTGEYTVITSYADADETRISQREGTTSAGKVETASFAVTSDGTYLAPTVDIVALLQELTQLTKQFKVPGPLHGRAQSMESHGRNYAKKPTGQAWEKLQRDFSRFAQELDAAIAKGKLTPDAIRSLTGLRNQLEEAGL